LKGIDGSDPSSSILQFAYPAYYREDKYMDAYASIHFGLIDIIHSSVDDADSCVSPSQSCEEYSLQYRTIAHDGGVVNTKILPVRSINRKNLVDIQGVNSDRMIKYMKLLEHLMSDEHVRVETIPFWGPKTWLGMSVYRAKVAFFLLFFVVLPISYALWLVGASVWYILRGAELARRTKLELQYQEYSRSMGGDKKNM